MPDSHRFGLTPLGFDVVEEIEAALRKLVSMHPAKRHGSLAQRAIQAGGVAEMTLGAVLIIGALFSPKGCQLAFMFITLLCADEREQYFL